MVRNVIMLTVASVLALTGAVQGDRYDDALRDAVRLETDLERDSTRKPTEILRFSGIKSGDTVFELFAGGGYYTMLLSSVVGPEGRVVAQNNQAYLDFAKKELEERADLGEPQNIQRLTSEINDLEFEDASLDYVTMVLAYHDFYFSADNWPEIHVPMLLSKLHKALKSNGQVLIVDHIAPEGSGHRAGRALHRIDPELVKSEMQSAGFRLVSVSDALKNSDDPLTIPMYHKSIRGKTSRFAMRFEKATP